MGEQRTPDMIGTEVGVRSDLRRGHPKPRECKTGRAREAYRSGFDAENGIKQSLSGQLKNQN